jgi:uncharacterized protein YbjQ (UPF0145 family)
MAIHKVDLRCETCKRTTAHLFEHPSTDFANTAICEVCETAREISFEVHSQLPTEYSVKLTTAPTLAGHEIVDTVEIITAECVLGMNALVDFAAGLRDLWGGRSKAVQDTLRQGRRLCLAELKKEAVELNANAVIGVRLDYSELSGGGKSMLFLVASGTAVRVVSSMDEGAASELDG